MKQNDTSSATQAAAEKAAELRQRAESRAKRPPARTETLSLAASQMTLHELHVYQVELEMQNDELRRTQAELDAVCERYTDLYDFAPVGYLTVSAKGLILEANLTLATLLGVARGTLASKPFSRFIRQEDAGVFYLFHKQLLATGEPYSCELRLVKSDRSTFWAHLAATAAENQNGAPVCRMALSDITARKQAQETLRESEERFHNLFEKAPLGYQSLDRDGRFIEVNHAWLETLGYTREEVLGKWFGDFLAPEYVQAFRERFSVFKAEGKVHNEFFMMHKNGSRRYISFDGRVGHHTDGSFKQTHCILKDETERKKVEQLLAESETRYKALHNASFGGIAIHDQGIILECNLGLSEMTGYDYSELIGMDGLLLIAERSREAVMKNIRTGYEKPYEAFGVRKNGEKFAMRLEARNVPYKGKQARTVEFRDITEHKRMAKALAEEADHRRILIEQSRDGIVILDLEGKVAEANRRFAEMLGYTLEEVRRLNVWDWDAQWTREELLGMVGEVDVTGALFETRHRRKDGSLRDVEISSNGSLYGGRKLVLCVCRRHHRAQAGRGLQRNGPGGPARPQRTG